MAADDEQSNGSPLQGAVGEVAAALARLERLVAAEDAWRSTDVEILSAVGDVARVRAGLEAVHLGLVRQVDERGVAQASPVATTPEGFLRTACLAGVTQARKDVAAARATAPGEVLEPFAALLRDGRCSRAHVDSAVRVLDKIPTAVLDEPGAGDEIVDYLMLATADADPLDLDRAGRQLVAMLAPDPSDRLDHEALQRRFVDLATDSTGMVVGRLQLDPVAGAALRAALQRWSGPESGADGERDMRQPRQRRADALAHLVETATAVEQPRRGERPRVVVHVTPEQLLDARNRPPGSPIGLAEVEGGDPIPTWAARRLACDAVLQRLVDRPTEGPLDVGRAQRLATLTQRRGLAARDGGCVVPGCGASPEICDAHHVVHWADGGPTDMDNLCLLCPGHHTAVHAGTWAVAIDAHQQVTVTPPRWVDRMQRPRPAWRQRVRRMTQAFRQPPTGPDGRAESPSPAWPSPSPPTPPDSTSFSSSSSPPSAGRAGVPSSAPPLRPTTTDPPDDVRELIDVLGGVRPSSQRARVPAYGPPGDTG